MAEKILVAGIQKKRDAISSIVKSVRKLKRLTEWARSSIAEIFKILRSFDMLLDKNTKKPTIYPQGYGNHLRQWVWLTPLGLGSYMLLCEYQDLNRSFFLDCSTRSEAGGRVCKVYDQVFCRIYGHDLKLEEYKRKTVFPCRDLVDSIHFLPCDVHLQVRSIRENVTVRALKDRWRI